MLLVNNNITILRIYNVAFIQEKKNKKNSIIIMFYNILNDLSRIISAVMNRLYNRRNLVKILQIPRRTDDQNIYKSTYGFIIHSFSSQMY